MFVSLRVVNLCSVGIVDRCIVGTVNCRVHEDALSSCLVYFVGLRYGRIKIILKI